MAEEIRKIGSSDMLFGSGTWNSPGGKPVTRLNAEHIPFAADVSKHLEALYPLAAGTAWRLFYADADGNLVALPFGASGEALVSSGPSLAPSWQVIAGGGGGSPPAGNPGQLQYNDGGVLGAIPGVGYNAGDESVLFPGAVVAGDPGDGGRWIEMLNQANFVPGVGKFGLTIKGGDLYAIVNGALKKIAMAAGLVVADNFIRTNENPLTFAGKWITAPGWNALKIDNNILLPTISGQYAGALWTGDVFSNDQFAEITLSAPGKYQGCIVRGSGASSISGYIFQVDGLNPSAGNIFRYDNGVQTQIATLVNINQFSGAMYRLCAVGSTISLQEWSGSAWVQKASVVDNTYASGSLGVIEYNSDTSSHISDWNGGDL